MIVTIYTFLNDVLFKKTGKTLDRKDSEEELKPYLLQRWVSMYNSKDTYNLVNYINNTSNKIWKALEDKEMWYKFMVSVIPRVKYEKIKYLKRNTERRDTTKNIDDVIEFLSKQNNISKREVREYIEKYGLDISSIKRSIRS